MMMHSVEIASEDERASVVSPTAWSTPSRARKDLSNSRCEYFGRTRARRSEVDAASEDERAHVDSSEPSARQRGELRVGRACAHDVMISTLTSSTCGRFVGLPTPLSWCPCKNAKLHIAPAPHSVR
jgi:hypothetical protein